MPDDAAGDRTLVAPPTPRTVWRGPCLGGSHRRCDRLRERADAVTAARRPGLPAPPHRPGHDRRLRHRQHDRVGRAQDPRRQALAPAALAGRDSRRAVLDPGAGVHAGRDRVAARAAGGARHARATAGFPRACTGNAGHRRADAAPRPAHPRRQQRPGPAGRSVDPHRPALDAAGHRGRPRRRRRCRHQRRPVLARVDVRRDERRHQRAEPPPTSASTAAAQTASRRGTPSDARAASTSATR